MKIYSVLFNHMHIKPSQLCILLCNSSYYIDRWFFQWPTHTGVYAFNSTIKTSDYHHYVGACTFPPFQYLYIKIKESTRLAQSAPSAIFSVLGFGILDFVNSNVQSFIFCVQDARSTV